MSMGIIMYYFILKSKSPRFTEAFAFIIYTTNYRAKLKRTTWRPLLVTTCSI